VANYPDNVDPVADPFGTDIGADVLDQWGVLRGVERRTVAECEAAIRSHPVFSAALEDEDDGPVIEAAIAILKAEDSA